MDDSDLLALLTKPNRNRKTKRKNSKKSFIRDRIHKLPKLYTNLTQKINSETSFSVIPVNADSYKTESEVESFSGDSNNDSSVFDYSLTELYDNPNDAAIGFISPEKATVINEMGHITEAPRKFNRDDVLEELGMHIIDKEYESLDSDYNI